MVPLKADGLEGASKVHKIILAQTPNSMGRNTWAEQLQALLLSNCTLRYLEFMAVCAHDMLPIFYKLDFNDACVLSETNTVRSKR